MVKITTWTASAILHKQNGHTDIMGQGIHSKITMAGDVVPYYTVTALVPTLK